MRADAQEPTVSRALQQLARRDTVVAVWFFGRDAYSLDAVAEAARATGATLRRRSRWLHAVSADLSTSALDVARRRPEFRHLQPVAVFAGTPEEPLGPAPLPAAPPAPGPAADTAAYGGGAMPMRRLNLFPLVDQELRGEGVRIALLDTGFETELAAFDSVRLGGRIVGQKDFVFSTDTFHDSIVRNEPADTFPDGRPSNASAHGTQVWSILAANVPGTHIGTAPDAEYLLAKTEDVRSETTAEEDNYVAALEWADSLGAHIVSSSLGYLTGSDFSYQPAELNGDIAVTTLAADMAAQRGIVVVTSAGNGGPSFRSLTTPADGDSVIAVGSEDSTGVLAGSSSRGPTADGRTKPDLTAPGVAVFVATSSGGFTRNSGTSFSAPIIAGTAALIRQLHPTLDNMAILEALKRTGTRRAQPDSSYGWGRPDGAAAAVFPRGIVVLVPAGPELGSATPGFEWVVSDLPAFAEPLEYRVRLARDTTLQSVVLDTVLTETTVRLLAPQRPDSLLFIGLTGTTLDGITFTTAVMGPYVTPAWATLVVLNDPAGSAVRTVRPTFRWVSPIVVSPPGPFTYDIRIIRDDDDVVELEAKDLVETQYEPPRDLETNTPYRWEVTAHLASDTATTASEGAFLILDDSAPVTTLLFQNFPNPFPSPVTRTETTCVWFDLASPGRVTLDILDVRGHVVTTLIPGGGFSPMLQPGRYGRPEAGASGRCDPSLEWDGSARDGSMAPRGIYLVRLATPDGTFFKRIVFLGAGR